MINSRIRVCEAAAHRLASEALLAEVAAGAKDQRARVEAIEKLTDQTLLARIATWDEDSYVCAVALSRLKSLRSQQ